MNAMISVSQLNFYIKSLLDGDGNLSSVFVTGEISNLSGHYRSGHLYFSLKDEKASVKAVMFSNSASRLRFLPENGMKVIVRGRVSVYEATGQYQLYVEDMQPDGAGSLAVAFEQLKSKLSREGLFDQTHKKPVPFMPRKIGVITSPAGAARRDIESILKRRFPLADVLLCPVLVQGADAAAQLVRAVKYLDGKNLCDVIILGRGGGSAEDLAAFNDETLARAVYGAKTPVISAVGHETDFTICDFVSDLRAPTPSAAAELCVPDREELKEELKRFSLRMEKQMDTMLSVKRARVDALASSRWLKSPFDCYITQNSLTLDRLSQRLSSGFEKEFTAKKQKLSMLSSKLDALSPLQILSRGYAVASRDGKALKSVSEVKCGDEFSLLLSDGSINCAVKE